MEAQPQSYHSSRERLSVLVISLIVQKITWQSDKMVEIFGENPNSEVVISAFKDSDVLYDGFNFKYTVDYFPNEIVVQLQEDIEE